MLSELQTRKLTKLFSMYDACCNGYLCKKDFESLAKKLAGVRHWGLRSPRYLGLSNQLTYDWKCLTRDADADHDHKVSLDEWLPYYDAVLSDPKQYEERVRSLMEMVFDIFDISKGGVNQQDWADLLSIYNVSPIYAATVFPALSSGQSETLDRDQILQLIHDFFYSDDPETPANAMFGPY